MTVLSRPRAASRRHALLAAALSLPLALAACTSETESEPAAGGSSGSSSSSSEPAGAPAPTGFDLPDGVELTEPGTELSLGEAATVAVEPDRARGSALTFSVEEIRQGRTADLNSYVLNDRARNATPYYVDVTIDNEGPGDFGGYAVPLYGQFDDEALVEATTFATPFDRCPSRALPRRFGPDRSAERCLVFLVPDSGDLQGVAFARAGFEPIAWSGSITGPEQESGDGGGGDGGDGGDGGNGGNGGGGGGNG